MHGLRSGWLRPIGRLKRNWSEVAEKDCRTLQLNKEDDMYRSKLRKLTTDIG